MNCVNKCSCSNISNRDEYIDLYNIPLALEIIRGQEFVLKLPMELDVESLSFVSQPFTDTFVKYDEGDWRVTMSSTSTAKFKLGIFPYTVKVDNYYLYSGTMNVVDNANSISSITNESSEINKFISPRYLFDLKSGFDSISQDVNTFIASASFGKKNKVEFESLIADLSSAESEKRLQSVRGAFVKKVNDAFVPYSISQDINFDADKVSIEFYYIDDYIDNCDHLVFDFTSSGVVMSVTMDDNYFLNGGNLDKFKEQLSKFIDEFNLFEFTLIEKKSDEDSSSCDFVAGEGIIISKDKVISTDADEKIAEAFNSANHLYKPTDSSDKSVWESGDGYLLGYKGATNGLTVGKIELKFERANAFYPYHPAISGTYYSSGLVDGNSLTTTLNFASNVSPLLTITGSGEIASMGERSISFENEWFATTSDDYKLTIPALTGTIALNNTCVLWNSDMSDDNVIEIDEDTYKTLCNFNNNNFILLSLFGDISKRYKMYNRQYLENDQGAMSNPVYTCIYNNTLFYAYVTESKVTFSEVSLVQDLSDYATKSTCDELSKKIETLTQTVTELSEKVAALEESLTKDY